MRGQSCFDTVHGKAKLVGRKFNGTGAFIQGGDVQGSEVKDLRLHREVQGEGIEEGAKEGLGCKLNVPGSRDKLRLRDQEGKEQVQLAAGSLATATGGRRPSRCCREWK